MGRQGDKRDLPPLLVVSSEGSAMYGTTDLATILDRRRTFDPEQVLYVVDQRQADHFEVVFRAAVLAGYAAEGQLEHIGFGTMNGTDGKPFKTREGGVLKLNDLIEMTRDRARERLRGYQAGLKTLGLRPDPALVMEVAPGLTSGAHAMVDMITRAPDVDAIFFAGDVLAVGALFFGERPTRRQLE